MPRLRYRASVEEPWTTGRMIEWMRADLARRGVDSPRLDAELIVADALGVQRMQLYLAMERPLSGEELAAVKARLIRRRTLEPMAYILGYRDFYKHRFMVGPDVLVPRPDSETLVERALVHVGAGTRVADLCTGSGCVGISIALERPEAEVMLTDLSAAALSVAERNAKELEAGVTLCAGDLFEALGDQVFDVITINPPYLSEADMKTVSPDIRDHEPHMALVAGPRGDEMLLRIATGAAKHLAPAGTLLVEVGARQAAAFSTTLAGAGWQNTRVHRDLGGIERVVEARREAAEEVESSERVDLDSDERMRRELDG